jgi:hypothetical protein
MRKTVFSTQVAVRIPIDVMSEIIDVARKRRVTRSRVIVDALRVAFDTPAKTPANILTTGKRK